MTNAIPKTGLLGDRKDRAGKSQLLSATYEHALSDACARRKAVGQSILALPRPFSGSSFPALTVWLGLAGLGAITLTGICFSVQLTHPLFTRELRSSTDPTMAARALDVAQTWGEDWARVARPIRVDAREAKDSAWIPTGGLSTLLATRFPSASNVRLPDVDGAMPSRSDSIARQSVERSKPTGIGPLLVMLPPKQKPSEFGIIAKLFGDPDRSAKALLAANPNTALYDIAKRAIYLPDGDKLEAHSGYGQWMDDPESSHRKNVGVTPPNVYAVSFRERAFHGVRALRMKPVGSGNMYGRDGILAHSYLLGDAGASNGCISVKDYKKFLKAYEEGKFTHVIVLPNTDEPVPAQFATAQAQAE